MTPSGRGRVSISLVLFALTAVLVFIAAAGTMNPWWAALAGIALAGTGVGAFADFHRRGKR